MLFDDPIQEEGQAVTTLALPSENQFIEEPAVKAPANAEQVLAIPQPQAEVALAPTTPAAAPNALRPDEMDETPTPKLQPKPAPKPRVEKPAYSETTNYGVNADEVDDEPPMKPKLQPKKVDEEGAAKKGRPEEELLKQMRAAKLLDVDGGAPVKSIAPVDADVAEVKKVVTPSAPKTPSRWYIQVGSFTNKAKADTLLEGLKAQGLPALLEPVQTEKGTSYRLRVGPELDGKRAAAMKRKMDEQHVPSILVSE